MRCMNRQPMRPFFRACAYTLVAVFAIPGAAAFVTATLKHDGSLAAVGALNGFFALVWWRIVREHSPAAAGPLKAGGGADRQELRNRAR